MDNLQELIQSAKLGFLFTLGLISYILTIFFVAEIPVIGAFLISFMVGFPMATASFYIVRKGK